MSNKKKLEDILKAHSSSPVNLSGEPVSNKNKKSYSAKLEKKEGNYTKIKDIYSDESEKKGVYILTTPQKTYRLIPNLLKILIAGSLILLLINSVNVYMKSLKLKDEITLSAYEGYSKLLEGSKSATKVEFIGARSAFESALESFKEAEENMWFIAADETIYAKQSDLTLSSGAIFKCGQHFAIAGEFFSSTLEELNKIPLYFVSKNEENAAQLEAQENFSEILEKGMDSSAKALNEIAMARDEMEKINTEILPAEIKSKLLYAKTKIDQIIETLKEAEVQFPAILRLLGDGKTHAYLILFQNNAELRPSGGFIGSYAIVEVKDGVITSLKVEDSYDLNGKTVLSPEILKDEMPEMIFGNSNYSPDFFFSGKKAAEVLKIEGGPEVDTVIAVNQSLLKNFLEITGPLQVGALKNKITADNYDAILTYIIEGKIWGEEDPKHVLKVMVPEFKKALIKREHLPAIMSEIYKAIQQKMVMAYSKDVVVQSFFDTIGVSGRTIKIGEKEDYLSVINTHTSFDANKTDFLIDEEITHSTFVQEDGSLIDEVNISRTHTFGREHQAKWNEIWDSFGFDHTTTPGFIVDILGRGQNIVNTRIYVPEGSQLLEIVGADKNAVKVKYDNELDKTCFMTKFMVNPQNTVSLTIKYKLPFKMDFSPLDTYKFIVQKQPGSLGSIFTKTISGAIPQAYYPEDAFIDSENKVVYATNLMYDKYFSTVLGE